MGKTKDNIDLLLNGSQLEEQLQKQLEFLQLIHPFLKEQTYHNECIEIRPIKRTPGYPIKSLNLWRIDEKAVDYYKKFLYKINGIPVCLYYSVFAFDSRQEYYKPDGTLYQKGCINNQNSKYTQILVMDFDGISEEEFNNQISILKSLGIETIDIFTGHGYQSIILLNERIYNKDILKDFTNLLLQKGFLVDDKIVDSARVMRMPFSFNCKAYDKNSKYYSDNPQPVEVTLLNLAYRRYSSDDIFFLISSLPDVNVSKEKTEHSDQSDKIANYETKTNLPDDFDIVEWYPMLKDKKLPEAVKNILYQTREGYRNKVLLFIIPFFRNYLQLEVSDIKDILSIWATRCIPRLEPSFVRKEVERLLTYEFDGNCGKYDESMKKEFGVLDIGEKDLYVLHSGKVLIPNQVFELYDSLSDGAVKLYFSMKAQEQLSSKKSWEIEEIMGFSNISKATFHRNIKELINFGLVLKHQGNRRAQEKTLYSLYKQLHFPTGYTLFDVGTIENMIHNAQKRLTDGEMKLFTYLYYKASVKGETWASQDKIALAIGKKRNSVSEMTDNLHHKKYLIKETYTGEDKKLHSRYIINYGYNYKPTILTQ